MTVSALCTEAAVREVLKLNGASDSRFSSDTIGSNIRTASTMLERWTGRILRDEPDLTLRFTTQGQARVTIPGLREASDVSLNGGVLTADSSYHLIPDPNQTGLYTAVQFRAYGYGFDYRSVPDWFERNLDNPRTWAYSGGSLPNDLEITGDWGFEDPPDAVMDAAKRLAAFLTLRTDTLLSGAKVTESGIFDLSKYPLEVQSFVMDWSIGSQAASG